MTYSYYIMALYAYNGDIKDCERKKKCKCSLTYTSILVTTVCYHQDVSFTVPPGYAGSNLNVCTISYQCLILIPHVTSSFPYIEG